MFWDVGGSGTYYGTTYSILKKQFTITSKHPNEYTSVYAPTLSPKLNLQN